MAGKEKPRSPTEATRFTSTTPHATAKPKAPPIIPVSRFSKASVSPTKPVAAPVIPTGRPTTPLIGGRIPPKETPEQRVARLRAAHDAAKNMKVSRFDAIINASRGFFDSAHKATVIGLVGLTVLAGMATVYTFIDMMRFNRKRKEEFVIMQAQMHADSLEAARLAYMRGDASAEQIKLVEEANARAEAGGAGFQMPSILGPPSAIKTEEREGEKLQTGATWPGSAEETKEEAKSGGYFGWFSSGAKNAEQSAGAVAQESKPLLTLEEKSAMIKEKARAAFEKEQESQRKGGLLDRVGSEGEVAVTPSKHAEPKKKGWW